MPDPLTLISSMATRLLLAELLPVYEAQTGERVVAESVGGVDAARRVRDGEAFDAVLLASTAIDALVADAFVVPGSRVDIVRSGVAVAVREGAALPDIGSEDALRAAVLAARSVGFSTGPSGTHLQQLFERWGITAQLQGRLVQAPPGVPVARLVAEGQVELGFQQLSELMHASGVTVVGALPGGVQFETIFAGGICATARDPERVRRLLAWLAAPPTRPIKSRHGMDAAS